VSTATFKIWRGDRANGGFQDYTTEISEGMVVLDAVEKAAGVSLLQRLLPVPGGAKAFPGPRVAIAPEQGVLEDQLEHLDIEPFLVPEIVGQERKRALGPVGDHADARPVEAGLGETGQGRVQQGSPGIAGRAFHENPQEEPSPAGRRPQTSRSLVRKKSAMRIHRLLVTTLLVGALPTPSAPPWVR